MVRKSDALERAIKLAGGAAKLAKLVGVSGAAVSQWAQVPANRVIAVERATGVSRHDLRPDLHPVDSAAE